MCLGVKLTETTGVDLEPFFEVRALFILFLPNKLLLHPKQKNFNKMIEIRL